MDLQIPIGSHFFTPQQLQSAIAATANLPPDKKGAFVGSLDASGAHAQLDVRLTDHIEFQGAADWEPGTKDVSGGAKIIASW